MNPKDIEKVLTEAGLVVSSVEDADTDKTIFVAAVTPNNVKHVTSFAASSTKADVASWGAALMKEYEEERAALAPKEEELPADDPVNEKNA